MPATPFETVPGVELFATGTYRGKTWTLADLDEMCRNGRRLGPKGLKLLNPPAVYGHEEEQEFLDRTDWPAAAWVDTDSLRVRKYADPASGKTEGVLVGDLTGVIPEAAEALRQKRYRKVSAEIYDDFRDDFGNSFGKAIRRVALLGGEVPQVKRLADIPDPVRMSERPRTLTPGEARMTGEGTWVCFAESGPMDRSRLLAAVQAAMPNVSRATFDAMTDDQLADLAKNAPTPPATPDPNAAGATPLMPMDDTTAPTEEPAMTREELIAALTEMGQDAAELEGLSDEDLQALYDEISEDAAEPPEGETEDMGDPAVMTRDELVAELSAAGQDAAALQGMTDDDLRALYAQVVGAATATTPAAPPPPAVPMSDRRRPADRFSERRRVATAARVHKMADQLYRQMARTFAENKKADAQAFCDRLVKEGRILPAHVADVYLPLLMSLDNTNSVHRHSEGGKTRMVSAYDLKKARLARLPVIVKYGERFGGDAGKADDSAEANKVERFSEAFSDSLTKGGIAPAVYVERFKELRKKNPALTAKAYGVPAEFC